MDDSQTDTLRGIKLSKVGKEPMQELQFVKDPKRVEILWEYARDAILAILRKGIPDTITTEEIDSNTGKVKVELKTHVIRHSLSIVELAKLSHDSSYVKKPITKSQVIHHLPKLIENGYVIKYGTLKSGLKGGRSTDYFRRTSNIFLFATMPGLGEKELKESYSRDIQRMEDVFGLKIEESEKEELLDLFVKESYLQQEGREHLIERARVDIAKIDDVELQRMLYRIYAFKSDEWIQTNKKIRDIIFSE